MDEDTSRGCSSRTCGTAAPGAGLPRPFTLGSMVEADDVMLPAMLEETHASDHRTCQEDRSWVGARTAAWERRSGCRETVRGASSRARLWGPPTVGGCSSSAVEPRSAHTGHAEPAGIHPPSLMCATRIHRRGRFSAAVVDPEPHHMRRRAGGCARRAGSASRAGATRARTDCRRRGRDAAGVSSPCARRKRRGDAVRRQRSRRRSGGGGAALRGSRRGVRGAAPASALPL